MNVLGRGVKYSVVENIRVLRDRIKTTIEIDKRVITSMMAMEQRLQPADFAYKNKARTGVSERASPTPETAL